MQAVVRDTMKLSSNKRKLTGDSAAATKEVDVPDTMSIVRWQMTSYDLLNLNQQSSNPLVANLIAIYCLSYPRPSLLQP